MEVGAFGLGGGGFEFNYANNADLMVALRAKGSCFSATTKMVPLCHHGHLVYIAVPVMRMVYYPSIHSPEM